MTPKCAVCKGWGCEFCPLEMVEEKWPGETWIDLADGEVEQLICDSLDELRRRGKLNQELERMWAL